MTSIADVTEVRVDVHRARLEGEIRRLNDELQEASRQLAEHAAQLTIARSHRAEALAVFRSVVGGEPAQDFLSEHGERWVALFIDRRKEVARFLHGALEAIEDVDARCVSCDDPENHKWRTCWVLQVLAELEGQTEIARQFDLAYEDAFEMDNIWVRRHPARDPSDPFSPLVRGGRAGHPCDRPITDVGSMTCERCGFSVAAHWGYR